MREKNNRKGNKHFKASSKGGETETVVVSDNNQFSHIQPVQAKALEVVVYNNSFDKALRAFRALVQKERILSAYKERQSYEKPSDKKRRERNEMRRKLLEVNSHKESNKTFKKNTKKHKSDNSDNE
jgi:ribosomal protein S21